MFTIQAKNETGDVLSLEVSPQDTYESVRVRLAARIGLEDPSRILFLHHVSLATSRSQERTEPVGLSEEALSDLLDELHAELNDDTGQEQEQEEEEEEEQGWHDGDQIEYEVQEEEPICVRLVERKEPLFGRDQMDDPFYVIDLHVEREGAGLQDAPLYVYPFLFHLRTGAYYPPSAWEITEDGIVFPSDVRYMSLQEMLFAKETELIPPRYRERIRRATGRKWVRVLRRMGRFRLAERSQRTETAPHEKQQWKRYYQIMKEEIQRAPFQPFRHT